MSVLTWVVGVSLHDCVGKELAMDRSLNQEGDGHTPKVMRKLKVEGERI